MPLSKQHYQAIAEIIDSLTVAMPPYVVLYRHELMKALASYFAADNPRFDAGRFEAAACASDPRRPAVLHYESTDRRVKVAKVYRQCGYRL